MAKTRDPCGIDQQAMLGACAGALDDALGRMRSSRRGGDAQGAAWGGRKRGGHRRGGCFRERGCDDRRGDLRHGRIARDPGRGLDVPPDDRRPGSAEDAAPTGGVITGWRARLGAMVAATFKLTVVRPAAGGQSTVVGASPAPTPVLIIDDVSFPARIPVATGDRIGLMVPAGPVVGTYEVVTTGSISSIAGDPQQGPLHTHRDNGGQATATASDPLELDADGDGYGDETQDACPADRRGRLHPRATAEPDLGRNADSGHDGAGPEAARGGRAARDVHRRRGGQPHAPPDAPCSTDAVGDDRAPNPPHLCAASRIARAAGPRSCSHERSPPDRGAYSRAPGRSERTLRDSAIFLRDAAGNRSPALTGRLTLKP